MLEGLFADASNPVMIDLLADCQNGAITMGNKIENVYGQETASVKALEEYCESIYLVSQSLQQPEQCEKYYDDSKAHLKAVAIHMEKEIPDKKEIVFMPYKASMWDSLESVYLAAKEDETCEAYVVPIPYFDRKPDKSLGEMHYEGAEYPKNISVTDWEQYNFEERCPDVIYIHNAYDDMNLVTCVHPRFFSSNLKKYTEELIYIPYFVLEEIEPDDQTKIEGMKHFCVLPGIIHADKVILQSEKMSQIYINEYAKALEAACVTADREQLRQKFLGLGSPKFDKVINTKKEDVEVPVEWLKIIQKPDGTWKKIVFYNTSVTALLKHEEKMLAKMKNVFEVFKERQEKVALLWRPHPLIKTTIEAMRPQLWEDYAKLVEQYKAEGWGIYDDTADMDRAVALSDAYYGDPSSIVELIKRRGKECIIQNVSNVNNVVLLDAYVRDEATVWASVPNANRLIKIDGSNQSTVSVKEQFPGTNGIDNLLFYKAIKYERDILFVPRMGNQPVLYNIDSNSFEIIELKYEEKTRDYKFISVCKKNEKVYLIPLNYSAIVEYDFKTKVVNEYKEIIEQIGKEISVNLTKKISHSADFDKDGFLWMSIYEHKKYVKVDLKNLSFQIFTASFEGGNIETLNVVGEKIFLGLNDGRVLVDGNKCLVAEEMLGKTWFSSEKVGRNIVYMSQDSSDLYVLDTDKFTIEKESIEKSIIVRNKTVMISNNDNLEFTYLDDANASINSFNMQTKKLNSETYYFKSLVEETR